MAQAGAEFASFVIEAAFGGQTVKTVQAYIDLTADAGGAEVQKEIGADLAFFSVNLKLGVSFPHSNNPCVLTPLQPAGIEKILPVGKIDEEEKTLLTAAIKELGPSIEKVS